MGREDRLTRPQQYSLVYREGSSWQSDLIIIKALPNNQDISRYGVSVNKRVGNAVKRNRVKRLLREIMKITALKPGWDIVYIVRPAAAEADFSALKSTVKGLLTQAALLEMEGNTARGSMLK